MSILALEEFFPVITPLGKGYAFIFESGEHDNYWTVIESSGAIVTYRQDQILAQPSYTHRRGITDEKMKLIVEEEVEKRMNKYKYER